MLGDQLITDPAITEEEVAAFAISEPEPVSTPRRRGRPRKQIASTEAAEEDAAGVPEDAPMPPREEPKPTAEKGKRGEPGFAPPPGKAYAIDCEMIGFGCVAIFGVIATVTRHDHWMRTLDQCRPISEPVARMIARMPAAKRKALTGALDPAILMAGIYQVAGPSIEEEARLMQMRRAGLVTSQRATGSAPAGADASSAFPPGGEADPGKLYVTPEMAAGIIQ